MGTQQKNLSLAFQEMAKNMNLDNTRVRMWWPDPHFTTGALDDNLMPVPYVSLEREVEKTVLGMPFKGYEPLISATLVSYNGGANELRVEHCADCHREQFYDYLNGYAQNQGIDRIV